MKLRNKQSMNFLNISSNSLFYVTTLAVLTIGFGIRVWMPHYTSESKLGVYESAAVVTESGDCAPIGKDILARGGSAIDAAISVLACLGAVNPESSGLGGGFHIVYYQKSENRIHHIDAREAAPMAATEDMYHGNGTLARLGGLAIAVPSSLAGYSYVHELFGNLPWNELFDGTIQLCRNGFRVNKFMYESIKLIEKDLMNDEFILMRNELTNPMTGELYKEGDIKYCFQLANTFETIADEGKNALYGPGPLADAFLADLKFAGSIIDELDMQTYTPKMRQPIHISLRNDMTLHTAGIPTGGPLIALMANIMNGYEDINAETPFSRSKTIEYLHRLLESMRFAYAYRFLIEDDDSDEMQKFINTITSKEYADKIRSLIKDTATYQQDPLVEVKKDHGTAHTSIIAPNGDTVSVTHTINTRFGSLVFSPSTGIVLNNEMDDFNSPNITNYYRVPSTSRNRIRPGKRPLSSMSPTIITNSNGDTRLVLGSSGGTHIPSSVIQVLLRNLLLDDNIKAAIDAPRFHYQYIPDIVFISDNFDKELISALRSLGHKNFEEITFRDIAHVAGIARGSDNKLYANSDYRSSGSSDGF